MNIEDIDIMSNVLGNRSLGDREFLEDSLISALHDVPVNVETVDDDDNDDREVEDLPKSKDVRYVNVPKVPELTDREMDEILSAMPELASVIDSKDDSAPDVVQVHVEEVEAEVKVENSDSDADATPSDKADKTPEPVDPPKRKRGRPRKDESTTSSTTSTAPGKKASNPIKKSSQASKSTKKTTSTKKTNTDGK